MTRCHFIVTLGFLLLTPNVFAGRREFSDKSLSTAKGRTGAVGLQLTLLKRTIKTGESLFVKTSLTNFSTKEMLVSEWIYRGSANLGEVWSGNSCNAANPEIEVRDSKGHRLKPNPYFDLSGNDSPFGQAVGTVDAGTSRHMKDLQSQGLTDPQITERLRDEEIARAEKDRSAKYPDIFLKQGQSVGSVSWCSGRARGNSPNAVTCPGNGFVELPIYSFELPGRYRIRAVRDFRPESADDKHRADEWDVRTATAWIDFEVIQ